jgi:SAM-dependent methyltransferase
MGLRRWYAERVFPQIIERVGGPQAHALRDRCVRGAQGRVLEIGLGTGASLESYGPAVTHLSVVEPSQGMHALAKERLAKCPFETSVHTLGAEALPFDDDSFDAIVSVWTLCSVDDPKAVLAELHRVLKPQGRFHVLEHVRSEDPRIARWQARLDPLQRVFACGCHLTRDTETDIRAGRFAFETIEHIECPDMPPPHPRLYPVILGVARPTQ